MARSDVEIFFSESAPAFAYPVGAKITAGANAVSAPEEPTGVTANITGAQITSVAGTIYAQPTISTIPNISVLVGGTYDLWQYVSTPLGTAVSSQVLNLDTNIATWSHATGLLTGVAAGTLSGLQLEVTY